MEVELSEEERCLHGNLLCIKKYCQICTPTKLDNYFSLQEFKDAFIEAIVNDPERLFNDLPSWASSQMLERIENHLTKNKTC